MNARRKSVEAHRAGTSHDPVVLGWYRWIALCLGLVYAAITTGLAFAELPPQRSVDLETQAEAMLERVNAARAEDGLPAYVVNPALQAAAQGHAEEIAEYTHYSHTSLDGRSARERVVDQGYAAGREGLRIGENYVARADVDDAFGWLMEDPPHRANILADVYREIGIGVGRTSYGFVWVMDLGSYVGVDADIIYDSIEPAVVATATPKLATLVAEGAGTGTTTAGGGSAHTHSDTQIQTPTASRRNNIAPPRRVDGAEPEMEPELELVPEGQGGGQAAERDTPASQGGQRSHFPGSGLFQMLSIVVAFGLGHALGRRRRESR